MKKVQRPILLLVLIFTVYAQQAQTVDHNIVLKNVTIIDVNSGESKLGTILIKNDLIEDIGYDKSVEVEQSIVYDLAGAFVVPGLIDAHVHLATDPNGTDNLENNLKRLNYLLSQGVTTVRDMAGDVRLLSYLSRSAALDEIASPDIYFSSLMAGRTFFDDPRTHASGRGVTPGDCVWMKAINEDTDLDIAVANAKGTGATGIKVYADLGKDIIAAIVEEAHKQGIAVWSHATVFPAKPLDIIEAKVDVISHASLLAWQGVGDMPSNAKARNQEIAYDFNNPVFLELIKSMKVNNTKLDATVAVFQPDKMDGGVGKRGVQLTKLAYEHGIQIGVGSDNMNLVDLPLVSPIQQEMEALQNFVGMTALDVLRSATIVNAEILGIQDSVGSIEVGKKANLLVLKENPLMDITKARQIKLVIKNGNVYVTD